MWPVMSQAFGSMCTQARVAFPDCARGASGNSRPTDASVRESQVSSCAARERRRLCIGRKSSSTMLRPAPRNTSRAGTPSVVPSAERAASKTDFMSLDIQSFSFRIVMSGTANSCLHRPAIVENANDLADAVGPVFALGQGDAVAQHLTLRGGIHPAL